MEGKGIILVRSRLMLGVVAGCLALVATACSKGSSSAEGTLSGTVSVSSDGGAPSVEASSSDSPTLEPSPSEGGGGGDEQIDLTGTWLGSWQNSKPDQSTGSFEIEWRQVGPGVEGTITIDGTPCLTGGVISGDVNGNDITFGAVSGEVDVEYTGNIDDKDTMSGTYSTSCGDAEGEWTATRKNGS